MAVKEQYAQPLTPQAAALQKAHKMSEKDRWTGELDRQLVQAGFVLAKPGETSCPIDKTVYSEYRFHHERMWRFDRAFPFKKLAVEIDGGAFGRVVQCHRCNSNVMRSLKDGRMVPVREGGRHNTGAGMEADHEKMNAAVALGWRVLRFMPKHIKDGYAANLIAKLVND